MRVQMICLGFSEQKAREGCLESGMVNEFNLYTLDWELVLQMQYVCVTHWYQDGFMLIEELAYVYF